MLSQRTEQLLFSTSCRVQGAASTADRFLRCNPNPCLTTNATGPPLSSSDRAVGRPTLRPPEVRPVPTCGKGLGHHPDHNSSSVAAAQLHQQVHHSPANLPRQRELRLRGTFGEISSAWRRCRHGPGPEPLVLRSIIRRRGMASQRGGRSAL